LKKKKSKTNINNFYEHFNLKAITKQHPIMPIQRNKTLKKAKKKEYLKKQKNF
jgi:hypothetical protein